MLHSRHSKQVAVGLRVSAIRLIVTISVGIISKVAWQCIFVIIFVISISVSVFSCLHFNIPITFLDSLFIIASSPPKRPVVQWHGVTCRVTSVVHLHKICRGLQISGLAVDLNKRWQKWCRVGSNGCGGVERLVGCIPRLHACANIDVLTLIGESTIHPVGYSYRSYMNRWAERNAHMNLLGWECGAVPSATKLVSRTL